MSSSDLAKSSNVTIETGKFGRLIVVRVRPNEDLITALESVCVNNGIRRCIVRGVVGSLIDAHLAFGPDEDEKLVSVDGPGVEILGINGELKLNGSGRFDTSLVGTVAAPSGKLFAGRMQRGRNRSFITIEVSLQEWIAEPMEGKHSSASLSDAFLF